MDDDLFSQAERFLPSYLLPKKRRELFEELTKFPEKLNYYSNDSSLRDELLQGDGWRGFLVRRFSDGESKSVQGLVVSNSCDVSAENPRHVQPNILFTPLVSLDRFLEGLKKKAGEESARSQADAFRKQQITSAFYLPATGKFGERIAFFDRISHHPLKYFYQGSPQPLFTLSQAGFWLLLLKLSIHFTRFQEDITR